MGGFSFRYFRLRLIAVTGKLPLSLEPRNAIEQFCLGALNTYPSAEFQLPATVVLIRAASFKNGNHELIGLLECPVSGNVFDEVRSFFQGLLPIRSEVLVLFPPPTKPSNRATRCPCSR